MQVISNCNPEQSAAHALSHQDATYSYAYMHIVCCIYVPYVYLVTVTVSYLDLESDHVFKAIGYGPRSSTDLQTTTLSILRADSSQSPLIKLLNFNCY